MLNQCNSQSCFQIYHSFNEKKNFKFNVILNFQFFIHTIYGTVFSVLEQKKE
jgi:hypothetical protein